MNITCKSDLKAPLIGLGTFRLTGHAATNTLLHAYDLGYRLIDTATSYNNHRDIAQAFKKIPRENLIIASKINEADLCDTDIFTACHKILNELQTDYLDILFLHHPYLDNLATLLDGMRRLREKNFIRSIGVSNFGKTHLLNLSDFLNDIDINQIEVHPLFYHSDFYQFCQQCQIKIMAYRPFANHSLMENKRIYKIIDEISHRHHKSWQQIILRWLIQQNILAIPKASSKKHLEENISVFDFNLSDSEMKCISSFNKNDQTYKNAYTALYPV